MTVKSHFGWVLGKLMFCCAILLLSSCGSSQQDQITTSAIFPASTPVSRDNKPTQPADAPYPSQSYPAEPYPPAEIHDGAGAATSGQLRHEWSIDTGDIDNLVVARDGMIYAMIVDPAPVRHIVLNQAGEVEQVTELPEDDRFDWYYLNENNRADGTFWFDDTYDPDDNVMTSEKNIVIVSILNDGRLQVLDLPSLPGDCTQLSQLTDSGAEAVLGSDNSGGGPICYYHIEDGRLVLDNMITVPPRHHITNFTESFGANGWVISYKDEDSMEIVHVSKNGDIVYRGKPEGLDLERPYDAYESPWGDLWLSYTEYDAIGAEVGDRVARISADGTLEYFDSLLPESYRESIVDIRRVYYFKESDEIFYLEKDRLVRLDRNYNILEEYLYPEELRINAWISMGYDGNIYVWDLSTDVLSKFARDQ